MIALVQRVRRAQVDVANQGPRIPQERLATLFELDHRLGGARQHLEHHAGESGIEQLLGTTVTRVDRDGPYWRVDTSAGPLWSRQVVVATGYEHTPVMPNWPGLDGFDGAVLHSSAYRNAEPFRDGRVLVVGAGSSGMEVVYDLAVGGADSAWLAVRTPPNIMLRALPGGIPSDYLATPLFDAPSRLVDPLARLGGRITVGDLSAFGLPTPSEDCCMVRIRG